MVTRLQHTVTVGQMLKCRIIHNIKQKTLCCHHILPNLHCKSFSSLKKAHANGKKTTFFSFTLYYLSESLWQLVGSLVMFGVFWFTLHHAFLYEPFRGCFTAASSLPCLQKTTLELCNLYVLKQKHYTFLLSHLFPSLTLSAWMCCLCFTSLWWPKRQPALKERKRKRERERDQLATAAQSAARPSPLACAETHRCLPTATLSFTHSVSSRIRVLPLDELRLWQRPVTRPENITAVMVSYHYFHSC